MSRLLASLIVKLFGAPPSRSAALEAKRRYTRRLYLRLLLPQIIVYGLLIVLDAPVWLLVIPAVGVMAWLVGFAEINIRIWIEQKNRAQE